jgi:MFS family permease
LGFSLISGSGEAMVYDRVNDAALYPKIAGRSQFFALVGLAAAGVVGPWLFTINFRFAYLFSALPFLLSGLVLFWFKEPKTFAKKFSINNHFNQLKLGVKMAFNSRFVLWAMGMLSLTFAVMYTFSNSYQPYLRDIGFSVRAFSLILPIMAAVQALGGSVADKLYWRAGENKTFALSVILLGILLVLLGFVNLRLSLIFLFAYCFLQGILQPIISVYSNRYIDSTFRATVLSVQSMVATLLASLMLFGFGFLTDKIGLSALLILLGALTFILGSLLVIIKPKKISE